MTKIEVPENNGTAQTLPFTVHTTFPSGEEAVVGAKGIILATGVLDIIPDTPGVKEAWGKGIFWCPVSWLTPEHPIQLATSLPNLEKKKPFD